MADTNVFVVDVDVRGRTGSRVVEVYIDSDAGVGVGEIAETSRRLSFLLDTEDPIVGHYTLNVSSPGVNRSLVDPRQYPRHIGRDLRVAYMLDAEALTAKGKLAAVAGDAIALTFPGQENPVEIPFSAISEAFVELPW